MKRFGYWRDPLFLAGCILYGLNRWWFKPHSSSAFLHGQFNDCLLIPCALPVILWLQRQFNLRHHDRFPSGIEIAFHLVVWSVLFEIIGPHFMRVSGDARDVAAYAVGGVIAWGWWHRQAQPRPCPNEL